MKIMYRPLWEAVQSSLKDIFVEGWPADKVIQRQLKSNRKWGSHDRRLYAEAVYDLVRWWRRLLYSVEIPWPKEDRWSDGDRAVFIRVIEAWCLIHNVGLDEAAPQVGLDERRVLSLWDDAHMSRAVRESIPDWIDALGEEQLGARWDKVLPALNGTAPVYLRANRLRTTVEKLVKILAQEKLEVEYVGGDCIKLLKRSNVSLTQAFKSGMFEVQDYHSQHVAPQVQAEPGQRVVDACAGAGGKSLHLASLMGNKGKIISLDVGEKKLDQLRLRATRAGASLIEARLIESSKTIKRLAESADRVLLDVPCSGFGIFRRNPDSKWKLTAQSLQELQTTQSEILRSYSNICKPGGILVYATCSLLPSENERQVEKFLSQNETKWKLEHQETLWPEAGGADGFYLARLRRL